MTSPTPNQQFNSAESVIDYFRSEVKKNGTADLAGIEEEIIVVDQQGKPLSHQRFQHFLSDLIRNLPEGEVIAGRSLHGGILPVLKGVFSGGYVQPETNTTLVELAHAPRDQAWGIYQQSKDFTTQLKLTAAEHGIHVIGGGVVPTMHWDDFGKDDVVIPNADYAYSCNHMQQGTRPEYCKTVFGTASVHHNMGFNDPDLMASYITTSLRMQPTMIALLGNSPLWDNQRAHIDDVPMLSYRSRVQIDYGNLFGEQDGAAYLYPDFLINPQASFESIINGYLDLPLDRTIIDGQKRECNGLTMRAYLNGYELDGKTHYPDAAALTMMIREPIVDVRPSFTGTGPRVETRAHDGVSQHVAVAIDAFYRGILENLDQAQALMSGITNKDLRLSRHLVCEQGLTSPVQHNHADITTQQDLALKLLEISESGLDSRGHGEAALLAPLFVLATTGINPATRLLSSQDDVDQTPQTILQAMDYARHGFADGTTYQWPQALPHTRRTLTVNAACNR